MKMFCCDLDNTLIYSWRRPLKGEKFCVEWLDGREISFLTETARKRLKKLREKLLFVPLTTRTLEQYQRIVFPGDIPEYALVCNGGVLLERGTPVEEWHKESLEMVQGCRGEMERGRVLLEQDRFRSLDVRWIQGLFLFTKSDKPEETEKLLRETLDLKKVELLVSRKKIYVIPKVLHKGIALKRLKKRLNAELVFAAGDGELDLPMLAAADFAAAPVELRDAARIRNSLDTSQVFNTIHYLEGPGPFSDKMLAWILKEMGDEPDLCRVRKDRTELGIHCAG